MGRVGLVIPNPPKIISKTQINVKNIQKPKSLASQLKGTTTVGKNCLFWIYTCTNSKKRTRKIK